MKQKPFHLLKLKYLVYISIFCITMLLFGAGVGIFTLIDKGTQTNSSEAGSVLNAYGNFANDLRGVIHFSDIIIEGNITKVLDSHWPTSDGKAPEDVTQIRELREKGIDLRTAVEISVKKVLKGTNVPNTLLFTALGGEYPGFNITYGTENDLQLLKEGFTVLVILSEAKEGAGPWSQISPYYLQTLFKIEGDNLFHPEKTMLYVDLLKQIKGE